MQERHTRLADLQTSLISGPGAAALRIVFLHGYNMQAADLTPFAHSLGIPGVAWAFPQAPTRVSDSGFAWWPSVGPRPPGEGGGARDLWDRYPPGREQAREQLSRLLAQLQNEFNEPLLLAGFSQGGMLACDAVLMDAATVTGLTLMSSSCIAFEDWNSQRARLAGLATFVSHGHGDADLSFAAGQRLADFLADSGALLTWFPFEGGHEIPFPVWRRFKQFVQAHLREPHEAQRHAYETH